MFRTTRVRAAVALVVIALSTLISLTLSPRLGLDLRGGTQITLRTQDSDTAKADQAATDRTIEVLRQRVDALGVTEPEIARSGERGIIVELPGVQNPKEAGEVLGRTAQLTFHPVTPEGQKPAKSLKDESGQRLNLGKAAMGGSAVKEAEAQLDQERGSGWTVNLDLRGDGERTWRELTGKAACHPVGDPQRRVAIVLDNKVISSPQVDESLRCGQGIAGGKTQITGTFGQEEADELALLINGGALPVPVETVEQRTVGASLGAEAVEASAYAAVLGVTLTGLFMIGVYRILGLLATLALACYGLISYAALLALGATLTLPGLAGFVLAIGMAVDANVLVFERAREEYLAPTGKRGARSIRTALTAGFRNALSAIADSNITTLLAAGLLFLFASGPVRGFAVTLGIGVLASMVSALLITRVLAEYAVQRWPLRQTPRLSGLAGHGWVRRWLTERQPPLMRYRRQWLAVSALALVVAGAGIGLRGLNLGVEFTGGRVVEYEVTRSVDVDRVRDAVADAGHPRAVVQESGEDRFTVRTGKLSDGGEERVRAAVAEVGGEAEKRRDEMIGPSLGKELRKGALIALGAAVLAQLAYLAARFRWTFATSTITAMVHDALILVGVFAWLGKPIDGVFVAALLTVIGYSVNDSVVVFDRVRELWAARSGRLLSSTVDSAVLTTVPRTINTGMGAMFILGALLVFGGDSLADFALALLIGIVVGTYSSLFTATPLALLLERWASAPPPKPKSRGKAGRSTRPAARAGDNGARV
ncbi:protein translocase subunit SecD [Streptomyces sp. NPDC005438]|uniref:protein translocase subunit SecD n=1 Tax=Streptomyces sp. NPDC005438 TaxID=3156880 RepID=UPI0033A27401